MTIIGLLFAASVSRPECWGKAMDVFFGGTGFISHLGKLPESSELRYLRAGVVVRIIKLMYSKILTSCHRAECVCSRLSV